VVVGIDFRSEMVFIFWSELVFAEPAVKPEVWIEF
jgi:hypothetical protein